jgi:hypothetical protein
MGIVKFLLLVAAVGVFGCSGDRSNFSRMNNQFLADVHACWLWSLRTHCEECNAGASCRGDPCESFESFMESRKKSCEKYKAGVLDNPISCEILEIYEVKYKNMPAPEPGRTVQAPTN